MTTKKRKTPVQATTTNIFTTAPPVEASEGDSALAIMAVRLAAEASRLRHGKTADAATIAIMDEVAGYAARKAHYLLGAEGVVFTITHRDAE